MFILLYIYIYMCVCVCLCVRVFSYIIGNFPIMPDPTTQILIQAQQLAHQQAAMQNIAAQQVRAFMLFISRRGVGVIVSKLKIVRVLCIKIKCIL